MKKLLIIGYFGFVNNQLDGQTVKTRNIYKLTINKLNNHNISIYDTQRLKFNKFSIFKLILYCMKSHKIFYITGQNNLKFFFLPLFFLAKLRDVNLYFFAVGGWLPDFINQRYFMQKCLSGLKVIFVENNAVKQGLREKYKFNNVSIIPNFRFTNFIPSNSIENIGNRRLRVVFMGRINTLKGIGTIFKLAKNIHHSFDKPPIQIDFYGPVDKNEIIYFHSNINKFTFVDYKGVLEPNDIYDTLSKYDVLVLPTKYPGEGFPGSILDAYISGIPVIVSNWKYLSECVDEGRSGFLIDADDEKGLLYYINYLLCNREKLLEMKSYAYEKSKQYSAEIAWERINTFL